MKKGMKCNDRFFFVLALFKIYIFDNKKNAFIADVMRVASLQVHLFGGI